ASSWWLAVRKGGAAFSAGNIDGFPLAWPPVRQYGRSRGAGRGSRTVESLKGLVKKLLVVVFAGMTVAEIFDLLVPTRQSAFVQRRRSLLILSRVRLVAA